eukprot:531981-Hanusia_phi.AAC.1
MSGNPPPITSTNASKTTTFDSEETTPAPATSAPPSKSSVNVILFIGIAAGVTVFLTTSVVVWYYRVSSKVKKASVDVPREGTEEVQATASDEYFTQQESQQQRTYSPQNPVVAPEVTASAQLVVQEAPLEPNEAGRESNTAAPTESKLSARNERTERSQDVEKKGRRSRRGTIEQAKKLRRSLLEESLQASIRTSIKGLTVADMDEFESFSRELREQTSRQESTGTRARADGKTSKACNDSMPEGKVRAGSEFETKCGILPVEEPRAGGESKEMRPKDGAEGRARAGKERKET